MPERRVLVVTYHYPPEPSVGALRWSLMAKYLNRLGCAVTILTSTASEIAASHDSTRVVRVGDLGSKSSLRRVLRRPSASGPAASASGDDALTRVLRNVVPDAYLLTWTPVALRAALRLARHRGVDCVVTTSPPESAHFVGLALQRLGPAWVADFRDGWMFESHRDPFPTRVQRVLDARLEAAVVRRADVTAAVTEEAAADFRRRLDIDAVCVPNGWDPELESAVASSAEPLRGWQAKSDRVRVVYTGKLGIGTTRRRSAEAFLRALQQFVSEEPELGRRLELVIAGSLAPRDSDFLQSVNCPDVIRHVGQLTNVDSHRLQRSADVLLLIGAPGSVVPAKLYEYLGARRPILHVGDPGAVSRILDETSRGLTVSSDDPQALIRALRRVAGSGFTVERPPEDFERYSYPFVARQMQLVIERAIKRRATHR